QRFVYDASLERAIREFERDHGLAVDGRPDPVLESTLKDFLTRMRAARTPSPPPEDAARPLGAAPDADPDDS
ncbi:MAG TPA: peptidoglycan-binding domain-containing protein, partial [bacterium]|nr:peptidoglycan-binding domain-containing protein [bacterium]